MLVSVQQGRTNQLHRTRLIFNGMFAKPRRMSNRHRAAVNPKTPTALFLISFEEKNRLGSKDGRSPTFLPLYRPLQVFSPALSNRMNTPSLCRRLPQHRAAGLLLRQSCMPCLLSCPARVECQRDRSQPNCQKKA